MRSPPSLLARLFLLVGLALMPAVVLLVASEVELRAERSQATRDQALRLARDASARLGRFIEGVREALVVLAEAPPVRSGDAAACNAMLLQLRDRFAEQIMLGAIDREGWVTCTTRGTPLRRIFDGDRSFFRQAMEHGAFTVSEWEEAASILRGGTVHFGLPIRGAAGEPARGVVGAAVGIAWIAELLRPVGLPPGAELLVVDRLDRVMLHLTEVPGHGLPGGAVVPPSLLRALPSLPAVAPGEDPEGHGAVVDATGPDGLRRILGLAPFVPGTGGALRLVVSLDAQRALAPVEAASRRGLQLTLIGMVLALAAAWIGGQRFVLRPVAALTRVAERWAAGHPGTRAAPALHASIPELASLAVALDRMAEAMEERDRATAALQENEARLSLALEAGGLAAWELDQGSGAMMRSARHDLLFGHAGPVTDWTWRRFLRQVLPEDRRMVTAAFRDHRKGSGTVTLEFRIRRADDDDTRWLEARGALHCAAGGSRKLLGVLADVTEQRRAEARLRLTVNELNHRVKNTLASVQSIANQTLRGPEGRDGAVPAAARAAFQSRLLALARSHEVLTREGWTGVDLSELVGLALAPHDTADGGKRSRIDGPPLRVPPRLAVPLTVALHELSTNAARHGALSMPEGSVAVRWYVQPSQDPEAMPVLHLRWQESGGPRVTPPQRRGFGTRLLEGGLGRELGGSVSLHFRPEGVVCELRAALRTQPAVAEAI